MSCVSIIMYDKLRGRCAGPAPPSHFGVDCAAALRNLACSKARYISALEWPVRLNRETMAGIAERVKRRGDGAGSGLADEWGLGEEECGLVAFVLGADEDSDGEDGLEGDSPVLDLEGSYSAYNRSNSSLASGTITPWLMRVSRYCEARYAL